MSAAHSTAPKTALGRFIAGLEESLIAALLGMMTLVTFANVVARYVFNTNILWALETTVFLFAWLVLIGMSYCVRINSHIGVDVVVAMLPPALRRIVTLIAALCSIVFAVLLLIGAWNYWAPFVGLKAVDPLSFSFVNSRNQAWYEVNDIWMPKWAQFVADAVNNGEPYEKMPRFIPYFALPLGMALLTFRLIEAAWMVLTGEKTLIIASHEAEDMLEEMSGKAGGER